MRRFILAAAVLVLALPVPARAAKMVINAQVEDMDGNTMPDLVLAYGDDKGIEVLAHDTVRSGLFPISAGSRVQPTSTGSWKQVVVADFGSLTGTLDGKPDVAAISSSNLGVKVWFQGPAFTFVEQSGTLPADGSFTGLAAGDVNGDGSPDIAFCASSGAQDRLQVWLGDRRGTWAQEAIPALNLPPGGQQDFTGILMADLNYDGVPDVLVGRAGGAGSRGAILYHGSGDGSFAPANRSAGNVVPVPATAAFGAAGILMADLNYDARPEFVIAATDGDRIRIFEQSLLGVWSNVGTLGSAAQTYSGIQTGDVDRDGLLDIVASSSAGPLPGPGIFLHVGQGAPFTFGAPQALAAGAALSVHLADLNADDTLDAIGTDPNTVTGSGGATIAWNHRHDIPASLSDGAAIYDPTGRPALYFNSLTNLEAGLKYRVEISASPTFTQATIVRDLNLAGAPVTGIWSKPAYAPFEQAQVRVDPPLAAGTWYWRAMTYARGRYSPTTKARTFVLSLAGPDPTPPARVQNLQMSKPAPNDVLLTWNKVETDVNGQFEANITYRIYRKDNPGDAWGAPIAIGIPQSTTPSHLIPGADPGYYTVRAFDGTNESSD